MRRRLQRLLVCPIDRTPLELIAWDTRRRPLEAAERARAGALGIDPTTLEEDVETGVLLNPVRKVAYPILGGVPRMLVFPTGVGARFEQDHGGRLRGELPGYHLPAM